METKNCKVCGKEINKKAEICPHCGCRIKSNTLKIVIICLTVIIGMIGLLIAYIKINDVREQKRVKKEQEKLKKEAQVLTKELESYIGKYKVIYDKELFQKEHPIYTLKEEIVIEEICHEEEGTVVDNCITMENSDAIEYVYNMNNHYVIYKDSNKNIFYFTLHPMVLNNNAQDASKETIKELELEQAYLCFEGDSKDLKQIECPKKIFENRIPNDLFDTKYHFELEKTNE